MMWNWQQPDWPDFSYDPSRIEVSEKRLLLGAGLRFGAFKHLGEDDKRQLTIELISNEALKTSEIEGEYLNRDSLQSSIRRQFGLLSDNRKVSPAEQGIAELMVSLHRGFAAPLSHTMLFEWHQMLANGRRDLHDIGPDCVKTQENFSAIPPDSLEKALKRIPNEFFDWLQNWIHFRFCDCATKLCP
jgi:Fic family protein